VELNERTAYFFLLPPPPFFKLKHHSLPCGFQVRKDVVLFLNPPSINLPSPRMFFFGA